MTYVGRRKKFYTVFFITVKGIISLKPSVTGETQTPGNATYFIRDSVLAQWEE